MLVKFENFRSKTTLVDRYIHLNNFRFDLKVSEFLLLAETLKDALVEVVAHR